MKSAKRIVLLAMDAGEGTLIRKWATDGSMPNLGCMLKRGLTGETRSLDGFFEGSTWPSFYTGATPAAHGFHWLAQIDPGTYDFNPCYTGDAVRKKPFWHYLGRNGRRVAVFDIPLTGLDKQINGMHVVEWGSHDPNYGFCASPAQLKSDILARFGRHPVQKVCDSYERTPAAFREFKENLLQGVKLKAALTQYYLKQEDWDFFAQVFSESHCVGHQCWHLHDVEHPNYSARISSITGNPVREVYCAIDSALGDILKQIDSQTTVVFLASHGMAHNVGAQFLLPEILLRLKVAEPVAQKDPLSRKANASAVLRSSLGKMGTALPQGIKKGLRPARKHFFQWLKGNGPGRPAWLSRISPENSLCFPLDNGLSVGGIRVNLAGREPSGIVQPGAEMDTFYSDLTAELLNIMDLESGKPMIKRLHRTADLYHGEHLDRLPDILVEWLDEKRIGSGKLTPVESSKVILFSKKTGKMEGAYSYCRTGDHRPGGVFVAVGPEIKPGRLERTVSIMDFAPTFAHLLGTVLPDADGQIINEIK